MIKKKNIIITGASHGIGRELALQYGRAGCHTALLARDTEALNELASMIGNSGGKAYPVYCDVSDKEIHDRSFSEAVDKLGTVDMAILNAGIGTSGHKEITDSDTLNYVFKVNTFAIAYGIEFLVPVFLKQGGGFIAGVTSLADTRGFPGTGIYSASKIAASHLLESARNEFKSKNIKIATVKPGFVKTRLTDNNDFFMPFIMSAEKAATVIIRKLEKEKLHIAFPVIMNFLAYLGKTAPSPVFDYFSTALKIKKKK